MIVSDAAALCGVLTQNWRDDVVGGFGFTAGLPGIFPPFLDVLLYLLYADCSIKRISKQTIVCYISWKLPFWKIYCCSMFIQRPIEMLHAYGQSRRLCRCRYLNIIFFCRFWIFITILLYNNWVKIIIWCDNSGSCGEKRRYLMKFGGLELLVLPLDGVDRSVGGVAVR